MHPFQVSFDFSNNILYSIIALIGALFVIGTLFYYQKNLRLLKKSLIAIALGVGSFYVIILFFGVLQSFYTTIKDQLNPNVQTATIVKYDQFTSTSRETQLRSTRKRTHANILYTPTLQYHDSAGNTRQTKGDVSYSSNNKRPIGSSVNVIVDGKQVRMLETSIKSFAFVMNIILVIFLLVFYYLFYVFAKTGDVASTFYRLGAVFVYVLFPFGFLILIFLFLNVGYEYFILNKKYTSFNSAAFCTGLGVFLLLCLFGYIKYFIEQSAKQRKKKLKKLQKAQQNQYPKEY